MPKNNIESYLDYKARVIDPVSKSFCAAKWNNATIWLAGGQTASCHHPPSHQIEVEEIQHNPSAIHNTRHKKKMRKLMLEGERPSECEYCWKFEDLGPEVVSDRVWKTLISTDKEIAAMAAADPDDDASLKTLEIAFDRTCNFACSYCNPSFSTTWVKDIKTDGPYTGLSSDKRQHYTHTHPSAAPFGRAQPNPYIEAFWKWWPELTQTLQQIRITGGEPLMSVDVWRLFDWFEKNPGTKMHFAINSNLGAKQEFIDRLVTKSHAVDNLDIYTSCEAFGAQAEYIRDGMDYKQWKANIHHLATHGNVKSLHCMMTINSLCLFSITEFLDDVMEMKRSYHHNFPAITMNILRWPTFQSPLVLPLAIRQSIADKLEAWLRKTLAAGELCSKTNRPLFQDHEKEHTERLINYLRNADEPHADPAPMERLVADFKNFYEQYDKRRGKDIYATFPPELGSWLRGESAEAEPQEDIDGWFDSVMGNDD
jgi:organic radical activating enzyme